jgi:hypothetical protein
MKLTFYKIVHPPRVHICHSQIYAMPQTSGHAGMKQMMFLKGGNIRPIIHDDIHLSELDEDSESSARDDDTVSHQSEDTVITIPPADTGPGCPGPTYHWTACSDDGCWSHYSSKDGAGYWPRQRSTARGAFTAEPGQIYMGFRGEGEFEKPKVLRGIGWKQTYVEERGILWEISWEKFRRGWTITGRKRKGMYQDHTQ